MTYDEFCSTWIPLGESLLPYAESILGSREDAEDVLQDLYVKLWRQRGTLDSVHNPPAYAVRVLKNMCVDFLRSKKPDVPLPEELEGLGRPDDRTEEREQVRRLALDIMKLPDTQRRILEMRTLQGLSYEEISEETGITKLSLRVLLSRARKTLRSNGKS